MALNLVPGNRYILINSKAQTALDLSGEDNESVIGYPRHRGENQQWEITYADQGWHIKNVATDKYLRYDGGEEDGSRLIATDSPFTWHIWPDTDEITAGRIVVPSTNLNVDLSGEGNPEPGTPVELWGRWEARNQVWHFEQV
ncbi:ricin B-like lectin [Agrocybe pediades]|nr:ricin B-like lectin [Agrocybe pediades]